MRLLSITNRYYIAIALALLLIGNAFLAYRMLYLFDNAITKNLLSEKQVIDDQLFKQKQIQRIPFVIGDHIEIQPIEKFTAFNVQVTDTEMFDQYEKHQVRYRVLSYEQQIDTSAYHITIRRRLAESHDIFFGILITLLIIGVDVVVSFYLLNWWFSKNIWLPFYRALNVLKAFDVRGKETQSSRDAMYGAPMFRKSDVEEFKMMNAELNKLMDKVTKDYSNLKEFTENMSHEIQTPLAIIHSRLDLLIQSENLTHVQHEQIMTTLEAVNRLSKMNKALVLLAKIDNNQFFEEQQFNIGRMIKKHLASFEPFIQAKGLVLSVNLQDDIFVEMNQHLADMLLSNLLSNAIRYNINNGILKVSFYDNRLMIENTGDRLSFPSEDLFERFKKGEKHDSVGLGLAIVKKICEYSGCKISYSWNNEMHRVIIDCNPSKIFHEEPIRA